MYKQRFEEIANQIESLRIEIYSGSHLKIDEPDDKIKLDDMLFSIQSKLRYEVREILDYYEYDESTVMDQKDMLLKQQKEIYQPISAQEARERAADNSSDTCEMELQAAMQSIYEAVKHGKTKCWCYTYLHQQCFNKLINNGYNVRNRSTQKDGYLFEISWG